MAKRRSYATLQSYLTPPFMESGVRSIYSGLQDRLKEYDRLLGSDSRDEKALEKASKAVKKAVLELGIHRELGLDTIPDTGYSEDEIMRIENFAEELVSEKVTGTQYVMGEPYDVKSLRSTVMSMSTDPVAYGLYAIDKAKGRAAAGLERRKAEFSAKYLTPAKRIVGNILDRGTAPGDAEICRTAGITADELSLARKFSAASGTDLFSMMVGMAEEMPGSSAKYADRSAGHAKHGMQNGMSAMMSAMEGSSISKEEKVLASAISETETALRNIIAYRNALADSPEKEISSLVNALNGGYTAPSPGGDPVANPNTLPTGRNLYAINAEATPSEEAWEKGKLLADNTIEMYRSRHNDSIPRNVSYTLWSSEFIETEGATIAQILYMLGVEPIRDAFGRVTDLRLIPSEELGRPRIDVVVQTSGQLRDIAASRLFLITRAVEMAAASKGDTYENFVASGVVDMEKRLTEKGLSPKDAREISMYRVFGGVNGNYGTGIQGMVQAGDKWEDEQYLGCSQSRPCL